MSTPVGPVADFGPLLLNVDIDDAVLATLKLWLPTYLRQQEIERDKSVGFFNRPKDESYANTLDDDEFPDHWLPAIIVTSAHTEGDPQKDGDGNYYAAWNVVVSAIVRGRTPPETRWVASQFEGAVRRTLVHQGVSIDGELRWTGSNVAPVRDPTNAGRYLAAGMSTFVVYADKVVQEGMGPYVPDDDEGPYVPPDPTDPDGTYEPPATVDRVLVDVVGRPPNQQLGSDE